MAKRDAKSQKIGLMAIVASALLGFAGLVGSLGQVRCGLGYFLGVSLSAAFDILPSLLLEAWHILQPCTPIHLRLLEGLLQVSISWQFVLNLAGAA